MPRPDRCAVKYCRRPRQKLRTLCHKHAKAQWRLEHPVISAWRGLIDRCRRKGREFALTAQDFIDFIEATSYMDNKGRHRHCFHIDRIDATRGYSRDNIQALTCTQNAIKGNKERKPECPF